MSEQTVALETEQAGRRSEAERRRAPRYPCALDAACQPVSGRAGHSWTAQVKNLSTSGVGLVLDRRFERGTILVLDLQGPGGDLARTVLARVVHVTPQGEKGWLLGCAFTSELDDDDLRVFCARRVRSDVSDCRAWVRFSCAVETSCQSVTPEAADPWQVKIMNISPGGVGVLVPAPVDLGALLNLELPGPAGQPRRTVPVRVVQAGQEMDGGWLVGCEFATQLDDADLQRLLD